MLQSVQLPPEPGAPTPPVAPLSPEPAAPPPFGAPAPIQEMPAPGLGEEPPSAVHELPTPLPPSSPPPSQPPPFAVAPPMSAPTPEPPAPATSALGAQKINLNTVTFEQLREHDLSVTQATRLLAHRERLGQFQSVDDLEQIAGFPQEVVDDLKLRSTV